MRVPLWIVATTFAALQVSPALGQALHGLHEKAGVACSACHAEVPPAAKTPDATCIACHGTMLDEGEALITPDPHRSPHLGPDELPACTECHGIHVEAENTCVMCHRGFQFRRRGTDTPGRQGESHERREE